MDANTIKAMVGTQIETMVIQAFKDTPDMVDSLVKAALTGDVNQHGGNTISYGDQRMPYLTFLVRNTIREVATRVVNTMVKEREAEIEAAVRVALREEVLVKGMTKVMLESLMKDWKVNVEFTPDTK